MGFILVRSEPSGRWRDIDADQTSHGKPGQRSRADEHQDEARLAFAEAEPALQECRPAEKKYANDELTTKTTLVRTDKT